jgi:hypothetical protein
LIPEMEQAALAASYFPRLTPSDQLTVAEAAMFQNITNRPSLSIPKEYLTMTISDPHAPSEHILRRASAKRTAGFVGVAGNANGAQLPLLIRLQFSNPTLDCHADFTLIDQHSLKSQMGIGSYGEDHKRPPEPDMPLLPPTSPAACPFARGGHCAFNDHLNITLGYEEVGCLVFLPSLNSLRALAPKRCAIPVIAGKRLTCHQMEFRLRGKPARQHAGMPIYYADITIRSGTTLEKTLANARGTASRWFRADRPGQGSFGARKDGSKESWSRLPADQGHR